MTARHRPVRPPGRPVRPLPRTTCGVARHTEAFLMKPHPLRHAASILICAAPALAVAPQLDHSPVTPAATELSRTTVSASPAPTDARPQPVQVARLTPVQLP